MHRAAAGFVVSILAVSPALAQTAPSSLAEPAPAAAAAAAPAAPAAEPPLPSFGSLFRGLGTDVRRLPSIETAVLVGLAGAVSLVVQNSDHQIIQHTAANERLDELLDSGSVLGSGWTQIGAALGTYAIGHLRHSPRVAAAGADLVRAQILNSAMTQSIKFAAGRKRPDGSRYSFPSGHTSSAFATAAVLQRHFGWKLGAPAYAAAAYIGGSRMAENKHYLSDVVFGAAIGVVAGRAVTVGRGRARFAVAPLPTPGGAAMSLTLVGAQ